MKLASPTVILHVDDVAASRLFLHDHLGFTVDVESDDFVVLSHHDHPLRIIFQPRTTPGSTALSTALEPLQIGFLVDDVDAIWARTKDTVRIGDPIQTMDMGERYFQMIDPNGVTYRFVQWVS